MQDNLQLEVWQLTDLGRERERNEDHYGSFEPEESESLSERGRLYLVADGMGGHQAGDVAAQYAVEQILFTYYNDPWIDTSENLAQAIRRVNADLYHKAQINPAHRGMGTTVVAAVVRDDELTVANVGDSRAYLVGGGHIRQISHDHSLVAERVAEGLLSPEQARSHPQRNIITRSVGNDTHVEVDLFHERIEPGHIILLCTDGLSGMVEDEEIAAVVSHADPQSGAEELVKMANERGGPDNITVTVIKVRESSLPWREGHSIPPQMRQGTEPTHSRWWRGWWHRSR